MFTIGPNELLTILLLVCLLFGASKIPELARNMGRAIGEFKKGQKEAELEVEELERRVREARKVEEVKKEELVRV